MQVADTKSFLYPDVVVVCDEPEFDTSHRPASLKNPTAVVEVLSASTVDHDLGAKLGHYRRLPSIAEVLFVHVEEPAVTRVAREASDRWSLIDRGPAGAVTLAGVEMTLGAIYERTESLPI